MPPNPEIHRISPTLLWLAPLDGAPIRDGRISGLKLWISPEDLAWMESGVPAEFDVVVLGVRLDGVAVPIAGMLTESLAILTIDALEDAARKRPPSGIEGRGYAVAPTRWLIDFVARNRQPPAVNPDPRAR